MPETAAELDLPAYFRRIEYAGDPRPDRETLAQIIRRHITHIPFENLNPLLGWPVSLDIEAVQRKLVAEGRGGYCFEQNLLLSHALRALGYRVTHLASRVVWNAPEDAPSPRSHMLLRVDLEEGPYLADVGFGVMAPTAPLRLEPDLEQSTPHEEFRLADRGGLFLLQARVGGEWKPLYRFDLVEQLLSDYQVSNWYTSTHPDSPFVRSLVAARVDQGRRYTLVNADLTEYPTGGEKRQQRLHSPHELRQALTGVFRINLPDTPELDPALQRVLERD